MWSRLKTFDYLLFLLPAALMVISVIFMYVLSYDRGGILAWRQGMFAILGLLAMAIFTFVDYRAWKGWSWWFLLGTVLLLILTVVLGNVYFGSKSWLALGTFQFQPSELAKLALIVALARVLQTGSQKLAWSKYILALLLLLLILVLILLQPDFGTALVVGVIGVTMLLHSQLIKSQRAIVIGLVLAVVSVMTLSFQNVQPFSGVLKDYQKNRLSSFVNPAGDPGGSGYNVLQSKIAVGSGGLLGQGLGFGSQSQLNFLPVVQSDFIFAAIAEAWGMVGSAALIITFMLLLTRILQAARRAQDDFGALICVGIATQIIFQLLISIGMNLGVMPVTGIPLPFLSYGGTSLLSLCISLGLVQAIVVRAKRLTF